MSMDVNESIEKIFVHKGKLIKKNRGYKQYIKSILKGHADGQKLTILPLFLKIIS